MKALLKFLGRLLGLHFAPDNHIIPVLRMGLYHRAGGPSFTWLIPLLEQALPPVKTSIHVGNFFFDEVMSKDNIPFEIQMTVLFTFDPDSALKNAAAVLVKGGEGLFQIIVKDYTNQGLRRLVARFDAEKLCGEVAMSDIEKNLTRFLTAELGVLGLAPLRSGGVLIKETIAPEKFKHGVLNAGRFGAMLQTLTSYHALGNLIEQAIQAGFVTGLEDLDGNLTFLPNMGLHLPYALDADTHGPSINKNGHNGHYVKNNLGQPRS